MKKIILICLLILPTSLYAEEPQLNTTAPPIEERDWQSFIDDASDDYSMKTRAAEAMRTLDNRLEEIVQEMEAHIDTKATSLLKSNQNAWEQQIRTKCSFLADTYRGGSYTDLAYRYCVVQEQVARAAELKQMQSYRSSP